jgi:hypothetical protein
VSCHFLSARSYLFVWKRTSENIDFLHPKFATKLSCKCPLFKTLPAHKLTSLCKSIMASRQLLACKYCGAQRFKTQYGLDQHVQRNLECAARASSALAANSAPVRFAPVEDLVYVPWELAAHGSQDLAVLKMDPVHSEANHMPNARSAAPNIKGGDLDAGLVNQAADESASGKSD